MKTVKKLLVLLLILCCLGTATIPAHAVEEVQPQTDSAYDAKVSLSINSRGQASCTVTVSTSSLSHYIEVSMSLNQIGKNAPLKSWSLSGNGSFSATKTYYVAQGHDYQVTAVITVKDSGGKLIESFTTTSSIVYY